MFMYSHMYHFIFIESKKLSQSDCFLDFIANAKREFFHRAYHDDEQMMILIALSMTPFS